MHTCLYSVNSAQTRRPLSARARRGGAFTADDLPGLAGTATRIRRHGPLAPVSRRGREDLWPFSAASGASRASDFDLLASLHGKSRSTRTSALPALLYGGDQGCGCRHGMLYLLYGRHSVSPCAFPLSHSPSPPFHTEAIISPARVSRLVSSTLGSTPSPPPS